MSTASNYQNLFTILSIVFVGSFLLFSCNEDISEVDDLVKEMLLSDYLEIVNSKPISISSFASLFENNDVKMVFSDHMNKEGMYLANAKQAAEKFQTIISRDSVPDSLTISDVSFEKNVYDFSLSDVFKITIARTYQSESVQETLFIRKSSDQFRLVLILLEISQ